jgi:uncharacterized protein (TIRG00374 family)
MESSSPVSSLRSWKVYIPLVLGIGISAFVIYQALQNTFFVETEIGQGTHSWVDINENGIIDQSQSSEFQLSANGQYKELTWTNLFSFLSAKANFWWGLAAAILFMVGRDFFYIVRIRHLTKKDLSWKQSFNVILLWEYASALSPGTVGGTAVAMFILQKEKIALGRSTSIVVITALLDNLFYLLFIPFVLYFAHIGGYFDLTSLESDSLVTAFWGAYALIFAVCLFLFMSIFVFPSLPKKVFRFFLKIKWLKKWEDKIMNTAEELRQTSLLMRREKLRFWMKAFVATCGSWLSRFMVINMLLAGALSIGMKEHLIIMSKQFVLWLLMLVSPTPGASGVAEYAFSELMQDFGTSALLIAAMALIWRLISYFPYLLIGTILLPRWLRNK